MVLRCPLSSVDTVIQARSRRGRDTAFVIMQSIQVWSFLVQAACSISSAENATAQQQELNYSKGASKRNLVSKLDILFDIFYVSMGLTPSLSCIEINDSVLRKRDTPEVASSSAPKPKRRVGRPPKYILEIRAKLGIIRSHYGVRALSSPIHSGY